MLNTATAAEPEIITCPIMEDHEFIVVACDGKCGGYLYITASVTYHSQYDNCY